MKRTLMPALLSCAVVLGGLLPASAHSDEDALTSTVMLPVRLAALGTGIAVGTPIATLKKTATRIPEATADIAADLGGADDPVSLAVATLPGIAAGTVIGVAEGISTGTTNAAANFVDRPFSPQSFSLDDGN